ncbi:MAG: hypothetical protein ACI9W4_002176 [Rhodothermales bacterium]|jgi:hypothetical protein
MQDLFRVVPSLDSPSAPLLFAMTDDDDWMEDPDNWDKPWGDEEEEEEEEDDEWADEDDDEDEEDDLDDENYDDEE